MIKLKKKILLKSILFLSFTVISVAYFIEYVLGHLPCNLCLIQRVSYILAIVLIALIFFTNRFEKQILLLMAFFFIFGAIVALYHVGVEQNIFREPFVCELGSKTFGETKEEILDQLNNNKISCKEVTFSIFGLSLATINTIVCFTLSGILTKNYFNYEKN